jgi:hypothetical protein
VLFVQLAAATRAGAAALAPGSDASRTATVPTAATAAQANDLLSVISDL